MVLSFNLTQVERIHDERHITLIREPGRVMLIVGLVAIRLAVFEYARMAAEVKDRRGRPVLLLGKVEIRADIQERERLEVDLLHSEILALNLSRHSDLKLGPLRKRK